MTTILGIDPGLAFTGFGIIRSDGLRFSHITHGTIATKKSTPHSKRLLAIYDGIVEIAQKYQPDRAALETLYFARNVTSGLLVSQSLGVILLALEHNKIPVYEFAPNTIKKTVTGIAQADKVQVQHCVKVILGLSDIPKPDHAADALAIAVTAVNAMPAAALDALYNGQKCATQDIKHV